MKRTALDIGIVIAVAGFLAWAAGSTYIIAKFYKAKAAVTNKGKDLWCKEGYCEYRDTLDEEYMPPLEEPR